MTWRIYGGQLAWETYGGQRVCSFFGRQWLHVLVGSPVGILLICSGLCPRLGKLSAFGGGAHLQDLYVESLPF